MGEALPEAVQVRRRSSQVVSRHIRQLFAPKRVIRQAPAVDDEQRRIEPVERLLHQTGLVLLGQQRRVRVLGSLLRGPVENLGGQREGIGRKGLGLRLAILHDFGNVERLPVQILVEVFAIGVDFLVEKMEGKADALAEFLSLADVGGESPLLDDFLVEAHEVALLHSPVVVEVHHDHLVSAPGTRPACSG